MTEDRRARKKRETRHALRIAALRLVDARGLDHVTVEMIAEQADVSPRTFFNYFPTKEAALLGPGTDTASEVEEFWSDRPAGESALCTLRAMVHDRSAVFAERSEELDLQMRVLNANPALYGRFHAGFHEIERVLRAQIARRCGLDPENDLYPRLLAAAGGAAIRSSLDLWRAASGRSLPGLVDEAFDLYATGLDVAPVSPPAPRRRRAAAVRRSTSAVAPAPSPVSA